MSRPILPTLFSWLALSFVIPACAHPSPNLRTRTTHPPKQAHVIMRRTSVAFYHAPNGRVFPNSNGITTRKVFLWAQPAKIGPHLREVPNGRPVQVVGAQGSFYAVIMHDGLRGWMPNDAVRPR